MDKTREKEMHQIELAIGQILRIGVIVATIVMLAGVVLLFINGGKTGYAANYIPTRPGEIFSGIIALKPFAVLVLGIFLLILTPVLRVAISIFAFAKEKDRLYVIITSIVLVILIISMIIGYLGK